MADFRDIEHAATRGLRNSWRTWTRKKSVFPVVGGFNFGDFSQTTPVSSKFGFDRGLPIDRFYIERFLSRYADDINGHVLEVAEDAYTSRFGGARVQQLDILHVGGDDAPENALIGDLRALPQIADETYDCIILTQVLQFIDTLEPAVREVSRILKSGGVCLATFSGIAALSTYDVERWGEYWRVTPQGAQQLFSSAFTGEVAVDCAGNVASACAFLQGLCTEDLGTAQLEAQDARYPVLVTVRACKHS